ncbi:molecular chaperone [Sphingomonas sp. S-NIH.Pt15_0812]|uniref:fimbrial biogenesis chaperone n=1 Tax=Sphingomonas sp. S-NIH.Pt15_0812 TaxID=1920129 RepID=UPI000F7F304D|nr:molecular chaperone [Sphingomonas sp. S-NIH.Pt15_0812]RSU52282.1 hypothetical protein BRX43_04830 [Sphingomonas sp. S-NIH.Pt15_0812]
MPTMIRTVLALVLAAPWFPAPADAGIVLSQVVLDILPSSDIAQNVEVTNDGADMAYVVVEPSEILAAGQPAEARRPIVDPGAGGLLVTPQRLILQPGERKTIRFAAIADRGAIDRIYRVTVKPVVGAVAAPSTALKLLVGYDVLVIIRPAVPLAKVAGARDGSTLVLRNDGNTNVELYDGRLCDAAAPTTCHDLPSRRLYVGQQWQQPLPGTGPVTYRVAVGKTSTLQRF